MIRNLRRGRSTRRAALALLAVASSVALAACSPEVPSVVTPTEPTQPPVAVTAEQLTRILTDTQSVFTAADAAKDPAQLAPRAMDPTVQMRTAQYKIATGLSDESRLSPIGFDPTLAIMTNQTGWPRYFMVTTSPTTDPTKFPIALFIQTDARSDYKVWGWANLLPGEFPDTVSPLEGAPAVPADSPGLVATPKDVVARYADLRQNGDQSQYVNDFAPDTFRTTIASSTEAYKASAASIGDFSNTVTPVENQIYSIQSSDGGAIVMTEYSEAQTVTLTLADSKFVLTGNVPPLLGTDTVTQNVTSSYTDIVGFYIPPAGSTDQIRVLGGAHTLVSVTGQ